MGSTPCRPTFTPTPILRKETDLIRLPPPPKPHPIPSQARDRPAQAASDWEMQMPSSLPSNG